LPLYPSLREGKMIGDLSELWRFRYLIRLLIGRNIKIKYQHSYLGLVWTFLNPLLILSVLLAVFTNVVRIDIDHYWAFLLSGFFVYHFVSQTAAASASVLPEYANMVRGVAFPRIIPILAAVTSRFLEFLIEIFCALLLLVAFHHGGIPPGFALLPYLIILMFALVLGLSLPISALSVYYYDVRHLLPIILTALFYISPVIYTVDMVPEEYRLLYLLNPLAGLLDLFHMTLYEGIMPSLTYLALFSLQVAVILMVGYVLFGRFKPEFAEVL